MKQWLKEFVHNCLVHPVLPFLPKEMAKKLHQQHGDWTFKQKTIYARDLSPEMLKNISEFVSLCFELNSDVSPVLNEFKKFMKEQKFDKKRTDIEQKINQGARLTNHRMELKNEN